jgi:pyridoxal phosphate-dependent aminotransferase EpsN
MLVSEDLELVEKARFLATQARDRAPHYQHSQIGYNYRLSNVLAGIGRGQLRVLNQRVAARRHNFEIYFQQLKNLPGIEFMPEANYGYATRWLTCITIDPQAFGGNREQLRLALLEQQIESRPVWKPLHIQPIFAECPCFGGAVAEDLFARGLCLPSGSNLTNEDLKTVISQIHIFHDESLKNNSKIPNSSLAISYSNN